MTPAVFLDRDGVLVEDVDLVTHTSQLNVLPGVPDALVQLKSAGFKLVVVSNQAVVARGLISESAVEAIHEYLGGVLSLSGAPALDRWLFCPHHPKANLESYRVDCECRKPKPGMLLRAARELAVDLNASFMVGDRITDIIAGHSAGCRTVLVETGKHLEKTIETSAPLNPAVKPDVTCKGLPEAVQWILRQQTK